MNISRMLRNEWNLLRVAVWLSLAGSLPAVAANINYSGGGTDPSLWTDPANWNGTTYPGATAVDNAYFYGVANMNSVVTPNGVNIYGVTAPNATINVAVGNSNWYANGNSQHYNLNVTSGGIFGSAVNNFLNQSGVISVSGTGQLHARFAIVLGTLNIQDSGYVNAARGFAFGQLRYANITGGTLITGNEGLLQTDGLITQSGGLVDINGTTGNLQINAGGAYQLSGTGVLDIEDNLDLIAAGASFQQTGGTLKLTKFVGGSGTYSNDGGIIQARSSQADFMSGLASATIGVGGATFDTSGFDITVGQALGGTGGITKTSAGTMTLSGASEYTGKTTVSGGVLKLAATGTINDSAEINVRSGATYDVSSVGGYTLQSGQTLSGNGTVLGAVTAGAGSTVSAGNSIGILVVDDLTLAGSSVSFFEIQGPGVAGIDFDQVQGLNDTLTYQAGWILQLKFLDPNPSSGTIRLFNFQNYSGTANLPTIQLVGSAAESTSFNTSTGELTFLNAYAIPEPSTGVLVMLAGLLVIGLRRHGEPLNRVRRRSLPVG